MAAMKKAIILARVSTAGQAEEELPIESQIEVSRAKAGELGADVIKVFIEDGVSGRKLNRDVFDEAVDYCELRDIDYFILWNTARFARHRALAAWTKFNLRRRGTEMVYVSQNIDTSTDEGWLLEGLFELMDENTSRTISKDTLRSMLKNARDGHFNGSGVPHGYRSVPNGQRRRLQVRPEEAEIVREIFFQFSNGAGTKSIAIALNSSGRLCRGKLWTKGRIIYLLKNWVYAGYLTFNRNDHANKRIRPESEWIRTKSHEPIIQEEAFMEVQKLFAERAPAVQRGSPKSRFLFTGLLRCGACGTGMQIESATGRNRVYSYYNCRGAQRGTGCANRRLPANDLDQWLLGFVLDRILSPERVAEIIQQIYELKGKFVKDREGKRADLVAELRNKEARRRRLYEVLELHGKDAPNLGDIGPRLAELNERMRAIETELTDLENQPVPQAKIGDREIREIGDYLRQLLEETGDPKKVREFLGSFIDKAVIAGDRVTIHYNQAKLIGSGGEVHNARNWHPNSSAQPGRAPRLRRGAIVANALIAAETCNRSRSDRQ
jgi:DNA invertase Pin-like site-specific DNA recombinase